MLTNRTGRTRPTRSIQMLAAACFIITFAVGAAVAGNTIHVPADYASIQQAIDAALDGDEIIVAPGTYNEAIDFLGKAIIVRSSDGPAVTTIDAQPLAPPIVSVVTFVSGEGRDSVLDGFTIRGGTGTVEASPFGSHAGGGVRIRESSPTVRNCVITQNMANYGAGISATHDADPLIENCHSFQNVGNGQVSWGAGIAIGVNSTGHVIDSIIESNMAFAGGGLLAHGNASLGGTLVENCQFLMNSGSNGGGVNVNTNGLAIFKNCSFVSNQGSGVFTFGSQSNPQGAVEFENCHFSAHTSNSAILTRGPTMVIASTFVGNKAAIAGLSPFGPELYSVVVSDSHFENHSGGVISQTHVGGSLTVTNCTFINNFAGSNSNSAGAINASGSTTITNCTFMGNKTTATTGGGAIYQAPVSSSTLHVSDSVFIDNLSQAAAGGAISNFRSAVIENSTFENNSAPSGGAVFTGGGGATESAISGCTFESNNATDDASGGGAIEKSGFSSILTVTNSSFVANESAGPGGAIRHNAGALTVIGSTLAGNSAASGGGVSRVESAGELQFQSTLFCENNPDHIDGEWTDLGGNAFHGECPDCAPADLNCDGVVGVADLLILLAAWGPCADCTPGNCPADLNGDCNVGVADMLILLANWG